MSHELILYVEDDSDMREAVRRALTNSGYEVVLAADGEVGWNAYQFKTPALVMTGLRMPRVCGEELIRRIREVNKIIPILVLTGYASLETATSLIKDFSVCDYLIKPVSAEVLVKSVRSCLIKSTQNAIGQV